MAAPSAAVEVGRSRAAADELQIHVRLAGLDVAKQPSVLVPVVERGVAGEVDGCAVGKQVAQREAGCRSVALAEELWRVDLDEPDASSVGQLDRIAVRDERDRRLRSGRFALRLGFAAAAGLEGDRDRSRGKRADQAPTGSPGRHWAEDYRRDRAAWKDSGGAEG